MRLLALDLNIPMFLTLSLHLQQHHLLVFSQLNMRKLGLGLVWGVRAGGRSPFTCRIVGHACTVI